VAAILHVAWLHSLRTWSGSRRRRDYRAWRGQVSLFDRNYLLYDQREIRSVLQIGRARSKGSRHRETIRISWCTPASAATTAASGSTAATFTAATGRHDDNNGQEDQPAKPNGFPRFQPTLPSAQKYQTRKATQRKVERLPVTWASSIAAADCVSQSRHRHGYERWARTREGY
jgi:hypothetical protein